MNWHRIEQILTGCTKKPGSVRHSQPGNFGDYAEVLARYCGIEGFIGPTQYLMLWTIDQMGELNAAYRVQELAPGILLIGTDGGDTAFGIDQESARYISIPLVGMSRDTARDAGATFEEFLEGLAKQ